MNKKKPKIMWGIIGGFILGVKFLRMKIFEDAGLL